MKLYILISDGGDGSYYPQFTLNGQLIEKLQKAADEGLMHYDNGVGMDGDGFHFEAINVPDGSTPESLGISVIDDDYADRFFDDSNE